MFSPVLTVLFCAVLSPFHWLSLWDPMDYSPVSPLFMGFPRQEYWSGLLHGSSWLRDWTCISYHLLHWQVGSLLLVTRGKPSVPITLLVSLLDFPFCLLGLFSRDVSCLHFNLSFSFSSAVIVLPLIVLYFIRVYKFRNFPGGPVAKTLCSLQQAWVWLWVRELDPTCWS